MKLVFFLIAFCLIFLRVYLGSSWSGNRDKRNVTITISNGDDYEQIKYSGKIGLNDDETGIETISPGGYIKYKHNKVKLVAEGGVQGNISYDIRDHGQQLNADPAGRMIIREALQEMTAYGFGGKERMMRLYQKGGDGALRSELDRLKSPEVSGMYREFLRSRDSL